jgi:hypothetical protein
MAIRIGINGFGRIGRLAEAFGERAILHELPGREHNDILSDPAIPGMVAAYVERALGREEER